MMTSAPANSGFAALLADSAARVEPSRPHQGRMRAKSGHGLQIEGLIFGPGELFQRLDVGLLCIHPGRTVRLDSGLEIEGSQVSGVIVRAIGALFAQDWLS